MKNVIKIKRIYDLPQNDDGYRILIDRLWPRGISKTEAQLDEWDRTIAPSNELRKWFGHQPELFEEFKVKFIEELQSNKGELHRLKKISEEQNLTLLYSAKDEKYNNAVVILELLQNLT